MDHVIFAMTYMSEVVYTKESPLKPMTNNLSGY